MKTVSFILTSILIAIAIKPISGLVSSLKVDNEKLPAEEVFNARVFNQAAAPLDKDLSVGEYPFNDPAGCVYSDSSLTSAEMLVNAQSQLPELDLAARRVPDAWNANLNGMVDIRSDPYAFEFIIDEYRQPNTYQADRVVSVFVTSGFSVWIREYFGHFRLLAVPLVAGVKDSIWSEYALNYWTLAEPADERIYTINKKLPCHWMIDQGWAEPETLVTMFNLDWRIPDYLTPGRKYLASNCSDANRIVATKIGYLDASTVCGPLAWQIIKDANSFPMGVGNWNSGPSLFKYANPASNGLPWAGFDPAEFDVIQVRSPMNTYDFANGFNLQKGDVIYAYSDIRELAGSESNFSNHIFIVADVDPSGNRITISNEGGPKNCSIKETIVYTPGENKTGALYETWSSLGKNGFDIFRWKWVSFHLSGETQNYTVRHGDTLETIAFEWKIAPEAIADANNLEVDAQLVAGQTIALSLGSH